MNRPITLAKRLVIAFAVLLWCTALSAQTTYNANDVAKLKAFFSQPSTVNGELNWQQLGIDPAEGDPTTWAADSAAWERIPSVSWDNTRVVSIDWYVNNSALYANLTGSLDLTGCDKLNSLDIDGAFIASLDVSGCGNLNNLYVGSANLQTINYSNTQLVYLDISSCPNLQTLNCSNTQLNNLNVSSCPNLQTLNCSGNFIPLNGLPPATGPYSASYTYHSQTLTELSPQSSPVDLSGMAIGIDAASSKCYDAAGNEIAGISLVNDVLTLPAGFTGSVTAHINTVDFPAQNGLPALVYKFEIPYVEYGDIETLKAFFSQPSAESGKKNWEQLGIAPADGDPLTWAADSAAWERIPNISWINGANNRRVSNISWWVNSLASHASLSGSLNVTGCDSLSYLDIDGTSIVSLDASNCGNLETLYFESVNLQTLNCSNGQLTAFWNTPPPSLQTLNCSGNSIDFDNLIPVANLSGVDYIYHSQQFAAAAPISPGQPVDLTAYNTGTNTTFACYDGNGQLISGAAVTHGILTMPAGYKGDVKVHISNDEFPAQNGLPALIYSFTIPGGGTPPAIEYVTANIDLELIDADIRNHIGLNPVEGSTQAVKGQPFELRVWLTGETDLSELVVRLNDEVLEPVNKETRSDNNLLRTSQQVWDIVYVYRMVLADDARISISGIRWNDGRSPVGIAQLPEGKANVYTTPGHIIIEQGSQPSAEQGSIHIYSITGQLVYSSPKGRAGETLSIPASKGIYVVITGNERQKVIVK